MKNLFLLLLGAALAAMAIVGFRAFNSRYDDHRTVLAFPRGMSGNEGMIALLKDKSREFHHPKNFYANTAKFDRLNAMPPPSDPDERFRWEFQRSQQALNCGKVEDAVKLAEGAVAEMDAAGYAGEWRLPLLEQQAITYFRQGELDNCLSNHNSESCIIPFTANAEHRMLEGSSKAIPVYERILQEYPDRHHARYMLNIAHITLGQHPDSVPAQFLVDPAILADSDELPRFVNVAAELGVDRFSSSGSAVVEDLNGDGYLDIFTSGFGLTEQAELFIADGKGGVS